MMMEMNLDRHFYVDRNMIKMTMGIQWGYDDGNIDCQQVYGKILEVLAGFFLGNYVFFSV